MLDSRVTVLREIARLYPMLVDPTNCRGDDRSDGGGVGLMPLTWTPTVKEYERLVKLMRDDRSEPLVKLDNGDKVSVRSLWWNLEHWHHRAVRVVKHDPVTAKAGGKLHQLRNADGSVLTRPRLAYLRDPKADVVRAERAIQFIASRWGLATEPMIPAPVLEGFKVAA